MTNVLFNPKTRTVAWPNLTHGGTSISILDEEYNVQVTYEHPTVKFDTAVDILTVNETFSDWQKRQIFQWVDLAPR